MAARTVAEFHYTDRLRSLAAGKLTSTLLQLVLELGVFEKLKERALSLKELGEELGMPAPSTRLIAQFLCREGLTVMRDGLLSNSPSTEKFVTGDTDELRRIHLIFRLELPLDQLRHRLFNPPVLHWYQIRDEGTISDASNLIRSEDPQRWLGNLMTSNHEVRLDGGEEVALLYDFSRHQTLLDVGGATGGYCTAIRQSNPHLRCILFDQEQVRPIAEKYITEAGDSDYVTFVAGNFFNELPKGADVVLVSQIIHHWTPEDGLTILRNIYDSMDPGGTLLVKEYFMNDDWSGPMGGIFEAFILLGQEGKSGWQPTYCEVERMVKETGFLNLERRPGLLVAQKSA
jgi:SAM-dependent methyltransferase